MRWLVTGANGMLGTDLVALLPLAGQDVTAAARRHRSTSPTPDAVDARGRRATTWSSTRRLDRRRRRRGARGRRRCAVNGEAPRLLARAAAGARRPAGADQHRLRVRRLRQHAVRRGRRRLPPASAYGRTKAAGEDGRPRGAPRRPPGRPHRLAVRRARRLLPQDHRPGRPRAGRGRASSTTRSASRPGPPTSPASSSRWSQADAPAGTYHATSAGRCSWFDFAQQRGRRRRPRVVDGAADDQRRRSCGPRPGRRTRCWGTTRWSGSASSPIGDWE